MHLSCEPGQMGRLIAPATDASEEDWGPGELLVSNRALSLLPTPRNDADFFTPLVGVFFSVNLVV